MERPNYRKASIYFDNETVLEVTQRGGGGSGVGGETGLAAVNLKTGESTNAALAAKDETIAEQAATIIELQEELADVPTIEALNVTANGTYSETGKAYSPVNVNVPGALIASNIGMALNFSSLNKHLLVISNNYVNFPSIQELTEDITIYTPLVCTSALKPSFVGCLIKAVDGSAITPSVTVNGWPGATPRNIPGLADGYTFVGADIRNVTGDPNISVPISINIT